MLNTYGKSSLGRLLLAALTMIVGMLAVQAVTATDAEAINRYKKRAITYEAHRYLGAKYSIGGWGYSCTELTSKIYGRALGIYLPQTLYGQLNKAWKHPGNIKKGDLVFYDSYRDGGIDHVAIYVGGGMVIDANAYYGKVLKHRTHSIPGYVDHIRIT